MSEPKEDIDLLSQKELEDGELEDGELDEPVINTNDNESEVFNAEILDDSDVNMSDKSALKNKKHKHHKKGLHRKRHLNSEEKNDNKWKKSKKSNDEDEDEELSPVNADPKNIINLDSDSPVEKYKDSEVSKSNDFVGSHKWGYESDEEPTSSNCKKYENNKFDIKQNTFEDVCKSKPKEIISSPSYEPSFIENEVPIFKEPVEVGKWNDYDSEDEGKVVTSNLKSINKSNLFEECHNNYQASKRLDNNYKNDNNRNKSDCNNWQTSNMSKSPVKTFDINVDKNNSPACDKSGWGYSSPSQDNGNSKINEEIAVSPKSNIDKGKWDYDSGDEGNDNSKNWTSQNSPKRNDNTQSWCSGNSPKRNDDCPKWESSDNLNRNDSDDKRKWGSNESPKRNNDNQRWGSRDSPRGNDDDNSQRWGYRDNRNNDDSGQRWGSRDGSRRNNFRRGGRDGFRRNNNFRRFGSRDGSQRGNNNQRWGYNNGSPQRNNDNNQRWGSSNNGSPQRSDDNKWGSNNASPQRNNDNKKWGSSNNSPQRTNDDNKKWGSNNNSPQRNDNEKNKWGSNNDSPKVQELANKDMYDLPQRTKWCSYDSDDDVPATEVKNSATEIKEDTNSDKWGTNNSPNQNKDRTNSWDTQNSPKAVDTVESSSGNAKWGDYDSDEEGKAPVKENTNNNNKSAWKAYSDDDSNNKGSLNENENRNKGSYNNNNNNNWNKNDRNDFKNDWGDRNKRWNNRNDNEKRNVCKYFSMGSCRHGDRCTYLHESPNKPPVSQEPKKKELCKFYEHQQCYKRANCSYMHEEFPCKLFHAGSKMCPSGDSCKYSHAPLNQETKSLLEKYLDEKVDERTDKNGSEWSSIIKKSAEDDDDDNTPSGFDQPENFFPDTIRYRYPGTHEMMRFPRPWTAMMRYGDLSMQVPPQMDFMHRQRLMYDRFQYPIPTGRIFPRGFRGMVPPNMHEGFPNGMPFPIPSVIPGTPKLVPGNQSELKDNFMVSDPYIDNLAQIVVGSKESSPKRLVDMLDPNMQCEDIDDFSLEIETNNSKKNLASPVIIKSPEIPPGAYVPRTSMNAAQPNVRLGPGPGFGGEQAMLYGSYPSHPGEMMDYINMSAIHYFHNHAESMGFDIPWKLILLEVPIKIPYPLMVIETQDLVHKYTDPRLKGHPSVLNSSSVNEESILHQHQNSYDFNSISNYGSQLQSPNFITTTSSETSETLTPLNDFLSKSDEPESPMFPIGEDVFNFKNKLETEDFSKRVSSDRSYLQDPRFKRKKVVNTVVDPSEIME